MRRYIAERDRLTVYRLPAYAPNLSPVEGIWSVLRRATLANRAFTDPHDLITAKAYADSSTATTFSTAAWPALDLSPPTLATSRFQPRYLAFNRHQTSIAS